MGLLPHTSQLMISLESVLRFELCWTTYSLQRAPKKQSLWDSGYEAALPPDVGSSDI